MINWSEVAPALKSLLSTLALRSPVSPDFLAQWSDAKREHLHPDVQKALLLRITRVADVMIERRYTYDADAAGAPPEPTLTEELYGMKEFTLEVRVDSHDHSEELNRWSWSMLDRVRTGLFFQRSIDALLAVNVGIVRISDSRDVSFKFDKHRVNAAMFEATFNAAFCLADTVPANWFEHVELTSQIAGPDGVTISSPPNVTGYVIPGPDPAGT